MVSDVVDQSGFEVLHRMLAAVFIDLLFFLLLSFSFLLLNFIIIIFQN